MGYRSGKAHHVIFYSADIYRSKDNGYTRRPKGRPALCLFLIIKASHPRPCRSRSKKLTSRACSSFSFCSCFIFRRQQAPYPSRMPCCDVRIPPHRLQRRAGMVKISSLLILIPSSVDQSARRDSGGRLFLSDASFPFSIGERSLSFLAPFPIQALQLVNIPPERVRFYRRFFGRLCKFLCMFRQCTDVPQLFRGISGWLSRL